MILAVTFEEFVRVATARNPRPKALGLLFAPPGATFVRRHVLPQMDYYHHASRENVHIWSVGYCAYVPRNEVPDVRSVAASISGTPWDFSPSRFEEVKTEIEARTNWQFGGDADFVIFSVEEDVNDDLSIAAAFESAFCFDLGELLMDGTIQSVEGLFESIFRFARVYRGNDLVSAFYASPALPESKLVPAGIRINWKSAKDDWRKLRYPGVIHHCASALEAMAKHVTGNPNVQDKQLGSFIDLYRKTSRLSPDRVDRIHSIYKRRGEAPNSGHGSNLPSNVSSDEAFSTMDFTAECVGLEFGARVRYVGSIQTDHAAA